MPTKAFSLTVSGKKCFSDSEIEHRMTNWQKHRHISLIQRCLVRNSTHYSSVEICSNNKPFFFNNKRYQIEICFIKRLRVSPTCIPRCKEEERQVLRNQYISFKNCLRLTRHLIALQCVTSWYFTKASSQRDLLLKVDMSVTANW